MLHVYSIWIVFGAIVVLGCFVRMGHVGMQIAIEKDWLVIIANQDPYTLTPALAFGLINLNALTVNGPMLAFMKNKLHTSGPQLAVLRGTSVLAGMLSTFFVPRLVKRIGLACTGLISLIFEANMLLVVLGSFMVEDYMQVDLVRTFMMGGVIISRMGVWGFELVQMQLSQEMIENQQAGLINCQQSVLVNIFELNHYVLTIIWRRPEEFIIPAFIGWLGIVAACGIYARFYYQTRLSNRVVLKDCISSMGKENGKGL
ncbi:uncharacterized protein VTP21DRAFT_2280 [Calcarisporiella thermophila]|uniref:uncharacterized protein n=1 Tax=Calcarisporiella thermophila TaxID=911321 RepID=UPI003742A5E6